MIGGRGVCRIDDQRIAYRRAGTAGRPVVLLHGGGPDAPPVSWRYVIEDLAESHRVYAPGWPGYGDSDPGGEHSVSRYVSLLEAFVDRLGLEAVSLAGISLGGAAALGYALERPDRVRELTLIGSYGLGPRIPGGSLWKAATFLPGSTAAAMVALATSREAARLGLGTLCADGGSLPADLVSDVRRWAGGRSAGRAFEAFQRHEIGLDGSARTDYRGVLEEVAVPTLLVHGEEDPLFPAEWSRAAAASIPDATCHVIPDCGHWAPREHPDRVVRLVRSFLT